jgi:hypothetical protein
MSLYGQTLAANSVVSPQVPGQFSGDMSIIGKLSATGDATLNGKLTTGNDLTVNGKITSTGDLSTQNITAATLITTGKTIIGANATPNGYLDVRQGDNSVPALSISSNSTSGGTQNVVEFRRQSDNGVRFKINPSGNAFFNDNVYLVSTLMVSSTSSTDFGGGTGNLIGLRNCTAPPSSAPSAGIVIYSEGGLLKIRGTDGVIRQLPNPPFFGTSTQSVTSGTNATLTNFTAVQSNSAFNVTTGVFTAPVACVIRFTLNVTLAAGATATLTGNSVIDIKTSSTLTGATLEIVTNLAAAGTCSLNLAAAGGNVTVNNLMMQYFQ